MTVTVTRKPGGITQLFNTDTGRVTYKCKGESAYISESKSLDIVMNLSNLLWDPPVLSETVFIALNDGMETGY